MKQKPRIASKGFFTPFLTSRIIVAAIIKAIVLFIMYFVINNLYGHDIAASSVFVLLAVIEILFSISCRNDRKSVFSIGIFSNSKMVMCVIGTILLQVLMLSFETTRSWLGVANIHSSVYLMLAIVAILTFIILEISKLILARIFKKY